MRPLIPRVYVGDVLKGTKNLRNWLRTASLYTYLNAIRCGEHPSAGNQLHTPTKEDKFLVTVNAWNTFGVYGYNDEVILLFARPTDAKNRKKDAWMGPRSFSRWFIRTPEKHTNAGNWPIAAYYMRAALHFNTAGPPSHPDVHALHFYCSGGYSSPFELAGNGHGLHKRDVDQVTRHWLPRGVTRAKVLGASSKRWPGWGPKLEDLDDMKRIIQELCSNPRVARKLRQNRQQASLVMDPAYLGLDE